MKILTKLHLRKCFFLQGLQLIETKRKFTYLMLPIKSIESDPSLNYLCWHEKIVGFNYRKMLPKLNVYKCLLDML